MLATANRTSSELLQFVDYVLKNQHTFHFIATISQTQLQDIALGCGQKSPRCIVELAATAPAAASV